MSSYILGGFKRILITLRFREYLINVGMLAESNILHCTSIRNPNGFAFVELETKEQAPKDIEVGGNLQISVECIHLVTICPHPSCTRLHSVFFVFRMFRTLCYSSLQYQHLL